MADRIYSLRQMPADTAPKGAAVLVAGGIAMRKTGGDWYSGMCDPPFSRKLNWTPEWWACIPQQNDPLPVRKIDAEKFRKATGQEPEQDDLDRCNCPMRGTGHLLCGWDADNDVPMFMSPKIFETLLQKQ